MLKLRSTYTYPETNTLKKRVYSDKVIQDAFNEKNFSSWNEDAVIPVYETTHDLYPVGTCSAKLEGRTVTLDITIDNHVLECVSSDYWRKMSCTLGDRGEVDDGDVNWIKFNGAYMSMFCAIKCKMEVIED